MGEQRLQFWSETGQLRTCEFGVVIYSRCTPEGLSCSFLMEEGEWKLNSSTSLANSFFYLETFRGWNFVEVYLDVALSPGSLLFSPLESLGARQTWIELLEGNSSSTALNKLQLSINTTHKLRIVLVSHHNHLQSGISDQLSSTKGECYSPEAAIGPPINYVCTPPMCLCWLGYVY